MLAQVRTCFSWNEHALSVAETARAGCMLLGQGESLPAVGVGSVWLSGDRDVLLRRAAGEWSPLLPGASPAAIRDGLLPSDRGRFDEAYEAALLESRRSLDLTDLFGFWSGGGGLR